MDVPRIDHHGAAGGAVTGSCHRLQLSPDRALLVDCGLFQGADAEGRGAMEQQRVHFPVDDICALVVTHVHIDHIGRLPYLIAAGYAGPILCSPPSARLLPLVIEDALKVGFTRDQELIDRFLERVDSQLQVVDFRAWHTVLDDPRHRLRIRLQRAGHILGSAYVEVDAASREGSGWRERIVFSGDLGAPDAPLLPEPQPPAQADRLVLEATYGDRLHGGRDDRKRRLKAAIDGALTNGGTVIIPAFSIGRTQEVLYELEGIIHGAGATESGTGGGGETDWRELDIVVDSPLAARFTRVYRDLKSYWDAEARERVEAGRHPLDFDQLITVDGHEDHLQMVAHLACSGRPAVVVAASGMATGGRVVNYLKSMLDDPRHAVLFVGYQAEGTPGRVIQQSGPTGARVLLEGEQHTIRARIDTISGYSAHADQAGLVRFVEGMAAWPREIRLVHGDDSARGALRNKLQAAAERADRDVRVLLPD